MEGRRRGGRGRPSSSWGAAPPAHCLGSLQGQSQDRAAHSPNRSTTAISLLMQHNGALGGEAAISATFSSFFLPKDGIAAAAQTEPKEGDRGLWGCSGAGARARDRVTTYMARARPRF